jgi:UDP-N-acetylglucosamine:LPS N-acetylglucosamine transferase
MAMPSERIADSLARLRFLQRCGPDDVSLRVMLLTSSLGSGHVMASRALEAALLERNPGMEIETVDVWSLMDPEVARAVRQAYLDTIAEEPQLYDEVYRLRQQTWRSLFDATESLPQRLETLIDHFSARVTQPNGGPCVPVTGDPHPSDRILLRYLHASLARRRRNGAATRALIRPVLSRWIWARLSRRLEQRVNDFRPHTAIATQMGPAALLAAIRSRRRLALPMIAVPTDFGIHDFWLQRGVGCFCVAHETVTHPDLPAGSLVRATGLPLMPGFRQLPERHAARVGLGLPPEKPVVLVAGGGLGLGVDELSEQIIAQVPGVIVVAVNGHNGSAGAPVQARSPFSFNRLLHFGWTDRMPSLLRAADVVVGKPGGLTVAESLACGRYLLAINSPGGQEGFNVRFLARHGAGALVHKEDVGERLRALLADPGKLHRLQAHVASLGGRDGAMQIAALALDAAREGREALTGARA